MRIWGVFFVDCDGNELFWDIELMFIGGLVNSFDIELLCDDFVELFYGVI